VQVLPVSSVAKVGRVMGGANAVTKILDSEGISPAEHEYDEATRLGLTRQKAGNWRRV